MYGTIRQNCVNGKYSDTERSLKTNVSECCFIINAKTWQQWPKKNFNLSMGTAEQSSVRSEKMLTYNHCFCTSLRHVLLVTYFDWMAKIAIVKSGRTNTWCSSLFICKLIPNLWRIYCPWAYETLMNYQVCRLLWSLHQDTINLWFLIYIVHSWIIRFQ